MTVSCQQRYGHRIANIKSKLALGVRYWDQASDRFRAAGIRVIIADGRFDEADIAALSAARDNARRDSSVEGSRIEKVSQRLACLTHDLEDVEFKGELGAKKLHVAISYLERAARGVPLVMLDRNLD